MHEWRNKRSSCSFIFSYFEMGVETSPPFYFDPAVQQMLMLFHTSLVPKSFILNFSCFLKLVFARGRHNFCMNSPQVYILR